MKILISAIACNPYLGSENYVGWAAVKCLARDHELWVLTSDRNREPLARAHAEGIVSDNIHFIYAGRFKEWHPSPMRARIQSWKEYLDYTRNILAVAGQLRQQVAFDLVHHVTYATWRVASPLWKLGIPFVFGPVGGYEHFPVRFASILSPAAAAFECARMLSNFTSRLSPSVRACIRNSAHLLVANPETERLVAVLRGGDGDVTRLSPAIYGADKIRPFLDQSVGKELGGPLRLFAGGKLEGRKGVALALRALARVKQRGVRFQYLLGGEGPETVHFKQLAAQLGLEKEVHFIPPLRGAEYYQELGKSHVFLLPSFRESTGLTMLEAMLAGCVPVVADCGGPGQILTEACGFKIPVTNRARLLAGLEEAIVRIDADRSLISRMGAAAAQRVATHFSEDNYLRTLNSIYKSATSRRT